MKALNQLWNLNINLDKLEQLAESLGSDVPFFIRGGLQWVKGIGNILNPIKLDLITDMKFILIIPPIHISTIWAYGALNKSLQQEINSPKFPPLSEQMNWELFDNDFERVIHETYPEIREIKANLQEAGALHAGLSGSGSTVFGVFDNLQKTKSVLDQFNKYQTFLSFPVFR